MQRRKKQERPRSLMEKFQFVEDRLLERGESIKPGSRLDVERRLLTLADGSPRAVQPQDPTFVDALEALRDYTLLEFVLERWPFSSRNTTANDKLRLMLRDAVDPYSQSTPTRGRDTQLELYVASWIHRGGLPVELLAPVQGARTPDIRSRLKGEDFYVEAKRPKTGPTVLVAVEDGADQIRSAGGPGALFLDVSMAFNPTRGQVTRQMPDAEFRRLHAEALRRGVRQFEAPLFDLLRGTEVGGIEFQDHQIRFHPIEGWKLESVCMSFPNPVASKTVARAWRALDRGFSRGS